MTCGIANAVQILKKKKKNEVQNLKNKETNPLQSSYRTQRERHAPSLAGQLLGLSAFIQGGRYKEREK